MRQPNKLEAGMDVHSSDGEKLGRVKQISTDGKYFRIDCPFAPDYYVPVTEIARTEEQVVHLRITKAHATNMGWEARPDGV